MSTQVLSGAPATIGVTLVDQNGSPRAALGAVTCTVTRSGGTVLYSSAATTPGAGTGVFTLGLTPADTASLDLLRAKWSEAGGAVIETIVEVVGGYMFSLAEMRAIPMLSDSGKYTDAVLFAARRAAEEECEAIAGRSPVPRFKRVRLDGRYTNGVRVPSFDLRKVRELHIDGVAQGSTILDGLSVEAYGAVYLSSGLLFPYGDGAIEVAYEYGVDEPPELVKEAALIRLQSFATLRKVGAPDRFDFTIVDGKLFASDAPGVRGSLTGIREVDSAYQWWGVRGGDSMSVPIG